MKFICLLFMTFSINSNAVNSCEQHVIDSLAQMHGNHKEYSYEISYLGDGFFDVSARTSTEVNEYEVTINSKCDVTSIVRITD